VKGVYHILFLMSFLILLVAGCSDDVAPEPKESQFKMFIYLPEQDAVTRGEYDIASDREKENKINTLQVWVFAYNSSSEPISIEEGEDKTTVGSLYVNLNNISLTGGAKEVAFYGITTDFKNKYPYLNVYAIANAASVGLDLGATTEESALQALTISDTYFGIDGTTKKPLVSDVSDNGLPMSACVKNAFVYKENELFTIANFTLKRAVSKIRFVFSRAENITASVSEIKLDGHVVYSEGHTYSYTNGDGKVLPESEYLFSGIHVDGDVSSTFLPVINFDVPTSIPSHINPWILRWEHEETRQEWEDRINDAISTGKAVECGRAYLRETPYRLTGTIKYKFQEEGDDSETTHSARFTMTDENEFLRGHSWTIYAYFSEGGVVFEVDGWEQQQVTFDPFI